MNSFDIVYEGDLYCRKISKAINRHWSSWKLRNCIIKNNGSIVVRNRDCKKDDINSMVIRKCENHFYANDKQNYTVVLKCCLYRCNESSSFREANSNRNSGNVQTKTSTFGVSDIELHVGFEQKSVRDQWKERIDQLLIQKNCLHSNSASLVLGSMIRYIEQSGLCPMLTSRHVHRSNSSNTLGCNMHEDPDGAKEQPSGSAVENLESKGLVMDSAVYHEVDLLNSVHPTSMLSNRVLRLPNPSSQHISLKYPKLNVLLIAVGTRGDIAPFAAMGSKLKNSFGYRVRLATHECFRKFVIDQGLEFYPLAGDPVKLSEFMVRSKGLLIPTSRELIADIPENYAMTVAIMRSCWDACVSMEADDDSPQFIADTIISNPVSYGHVHCAEALGIPLQIMFPQPWVATKAFPHPLSYFSYANRWTLDSYMSYQMVERLMWMSMEKDINNFRTDVLGLEPIRTLEHGWNMLNYNRVPFIEMWSESLVPRPKDWGPHVNISGFFMDSNASKEKERRGAQGGNDSDMMSKGLRKSDLVQINAEKLNNDYIPSDELARFLHLSSPAQSESAVDKDAFENESRKQRNQKPKPMPILFIGFGSMVIADEVEEMLGKVLEAAALTNIRILYQTGWSGLSTEKFKQLAKAAAVNARAIQEADRLMGQSGSLLKGPSRQKMKDVLLVDSRGSDVGGYTAALYAKLKQAAAVTVKGINQVTIAAGNTRVGELTTKAHPLVKATATYVSDTIQYAAESATTATSAAVDYIGNGIKTTRESLTSSVGDYGSITDIDPPVGRSSDSNSIEFDRISTPDLSDMDVSEADNSWEEVGGGIGDWDWDCEKDALLIGPCPHSWLFPHVSSVMHHGGAGTTAAGLLAGKTTMICPFFGDQHFWGEMVWRGGYGPKPCSIKQFTVPTLLDSFVILQAPETRSAVLELSRCMHRESGVDTAINLFHEQLPVTDMLCDVSVFLPRCKSSESDAWDESRNLDDKVQSAKVFCNNCGLKMCSSVCKIIHGTQRVLPGTQSCRTEIDALQSLCCRHSIEPCIYSHYGVQGPNNVVEGLIQGVAGGIYGLADAITIPFTTVYNEGIGGATRSLTKGVLKGVQNLMSNTADSGDAATATGGKNVLLERFKEEVLKSQVVQDEGKDKKQSLEMGMNLAGSTIIDTEPNSPASGSVRSSPGSDVESDVESDVLSHEDVFDLDFDAAPSSYRMQSSMAFNNLGSPVVRTHTTRGVLPTYSPLPVKKGGLRNSSFIGRRDADSLKLNGYDALVSRSCYFVRNSRSGIAHDPTDFLNEPIPDATSIRLLDLSTHGVESANAIQDCESPHLSDLESESGSDLLDGETDGMEHGCNMNVHTGMQSSYPLLHITPEEAEVMIAYETAYQVQSLLMLIGGEFDEADALKRNKEMHQVLHGDASGSMSKATTTSQQHLPYSAPGTVTATEPRLLRSVSKYHLFTFLSHTLLVQCNQSLNGTNISQDVLSELLELKQRFQHFLSKSNEFECMHNISTGNSCPSTVPIVNQWSEIENLLYYLDTVDIVEMAMQVRCYM